MEEDMELHLFSSHEERKLPALGWITSNQVWTNSVQKNFQTTEAIVKTVGSFANR